MTRPPSAKRLSLLGAFALLSSIGFLAPACITTGAVPCGDDGFCPPGTICTPDQTPPVCVPARGCGNGEVDDAAGEVCDDGNVQDGDGCNSTCTSDERCGNRFTDEQIDEPEECDQGEETSTCDDDCTRAECGDNHLNKEAGEVCDDGNTDAGDGCDADCKSEECGNGIEEPAFDEECDDGRHCENGDECDEDEDCESGDRVCKPRNDDGCSADCQDESCGNGQRDPGEQCDDGNDNNNDDCVILSSTECLAAECGDGFVHNEEGGSEECDEGEDTPDCNRDCTISVCGDGKTNRADGEDCDDGGESPTCNANCTFAVCGDEIENTTAGEECDEGKNDTADCNKDCTDAECGDGYRNYPAGEICDTGGPTSFCNSLCQLTDCGDDVTDVGEECDDDGHSPECNDDCTFAMCGDGIVNPSFVIDPFANADPAMTEQCDPETGTEDNSDQRALSSSPACDRDCTFARCGDGFRNAEANEECDDQYASGTKPHAAACDANCTLPACGDGTVNPAFSVDLLESSGTLPGEQCDPNTGTTSNSKRATADTATCNRDCSAPRCGDGYTNTSAGETCDDAFLASGPKPNSEGCDSDCTAPACGDGITNETFDIDFLGTPEVDTGWPEQCDPKTGTTADAQRALDNNEFCDLDCSTARCGDAYINEDAGEECEHSFRGSGSPVPSTADCSSNCTIPRCGDGVISNHVINEECEPGTVDAPRITGDRALASIETSECNRNCTDRACGDGEVNSVAGEECDPNTGATGNPDRAQNDGSACNDDCTDVECGDGIENTAAGETCDDGNGDNDDDCVEVGGVCKDAECGDGHRHATNEECDDGDDDDADGCKNDCTLP
jgi:cysteine-rich repeat protein